MNEQSFEPPFFVAILFFLCVFPLMWLIVLSVLAQVGGWAKLAKAYQFAGEFKGERWSLESAMLNSTRYKSCLVIGANPDGLYMQPIFIFRYAHPPLFIPWADISTKPAKSILFWHTELTFQQASNISLKIGKGLTNRITKAAGDNRSGSNLESDSF